MTMFKLPNFCRVCLKYDKNLIDLEHIENEPNETLIRKLQQCVSEVEWSVFKPLLCHPCIKRLNIAYNFKRQCVQSANVLKSYMAIIEGDDFKEDENASEASPLLMAPNQNLIKIVMDSQNEDYKNLIINLVPTPTTITPVIPGDSKNNRDTNQNTFLNLDNIFRKYIPSSVVTPQSKNDVSQLLTEATSEELSCEIDPTDLALDDDGSENEDCNNDWTELNRLSQLNGSNVRNDKGAYGNFISIHAKHQSTEEQVNFINSGQHFLSSSHNFQGNMSCERCNKTFLTIKHLKSHIKDSHEGNYPFQCEHCQKKFVLRSDYDSCMKSHHYSGYKSDQDEGGDVNCDLCPRSFNSHSGLMRHKVKKHNEKARKRYFIKGMKNAKCDICNREFSTQSYMQLHKKLHMRDDVGYKHKVLGKNRYRKKVGKDSNQKIQAENSDCDERHATNLLQPEVVMDTT